MADLAAVRVRPVPAARPALRTVLAGLCLTEIWVVEIDPFDPNSRPIKRTALGRVKHESAYVHVAKSGRVVVYTGDDQVNEHVYKFVSRESWQGARARGRSPLDDGTLFVARFNDDGTGEWLPLVHGRNGLTAGNGFADQGDVLVKTRLAASMAGATRMDRPEWVSVDPRTGMVYLTLTNNTSSAKVMSAANPRTPNPWGHIVRWKEKGGDHAATTFEWDLFLLASHDQMLAANPYVSDPEGAPELRRFLTGVPGCEVTGVVTTPDQRTMFVNIQHPGDGSPSQWPGRDDRPRRRSERSRPTARAVPEWRLSRIRPLISPLLLGESPIRGPAER